MHALALLCATDWALIKPVISPGSTAKAFLSCSLYKCSDTETILDEQALRFFLTPNTRRDNKHLELGLDPGPPVPLALALLTTQAAWINIADI